MMNEQYAALLDRARPADDREDEERFAMRLPDDRQKHGNRSRRVHGLELLAHFPPSVSETVPGRQLNRRETPSLPPEARRSRRSKTRALRQHCPE